MLKLLHATGGVVASCLVATLLAAAVLAERVGADGRGARSETLAGSPGLLAIMAVPTLVLLPGAITLSRLAAAGRLDAGLLDDLFHGPRAAEIAAGSMNLALFALNLRDGLRPSSGRGAPSASPVAG